MSIIQLEYYNRYGEFLRTSSRVFDEIEDAVSYGNYIIKISKFGKVDKRPSAFKFRWLTLKSSACSVNVQL